MITPVMAEDSSLPGKAWGGTGVMYLEINKQTNGSFVWKMPAIEACFEKDNFYFEPEAALLFTSPRGDFLTPNHHSFDVNLNFGVNMPFWNGAFVSFSQGIRTIFDGNSDGLAEGMDYYNTMRCGVEF